MAGGFGPVDGRNSPQTEPASISRALRHKLVELAPEIVDAGLIPWECSGGAPSTGFKGKFGPSGGVRGGGVAQCTFCYNRPGARPPLRVSRYIREVKMVNAVPLGSCQWLPLRSVPVYANSRKSTQGKGKASLPSFASLGGGVWVVEIEMRCVDCHCNLLG